MKTTLRHIVPALLLWATLLTAQAQCFVRTYWPMHSGDYKYYAGGGYDVTISFYSSSYYPSSYEMYEDFSFSSSYYGYSGPELRLYGGDASGIFLDFDPPIVELNDPLLAKGGSKSVNSSTYYAGYDVIITGTVSVSLIGTVTVPAGTYQNCRSVTMSLTGTIAGIGSETLGTTAYVVAPGVGVVRQKMIDENGAQIWLDLVSGSVGGQSVGSLAAGSAILPPAISTHPRLNSVVTNNTALNLSAVATGGGLSYQWLRNNVPLTNDARVTGATTSALRISPAGFADAGTYAVLVANSACTARSSNAVVSVVLDSIKPTVTITSPTSGQRWSNATFQATGTAKDNALLASVWCQVNNSSWQLGSTSNGWTNWTALLNLSPGTNTLRAYSIDADGNKSATNSVNFVYVLTAPLCLTTVGNGKVTGATNGQPLEIGKSITLTATPGTGWVLTNWLVQVDGNTIISTNKAVPFPMQSNLCVTATFADIAKPALTITTPTANQRWSNEVFTVTGKVTDNNTNGTVYYQLNGGAWEEASGWTNWSVVVNLLPGTNNVKAFALDAAGNRSATNSVNWVRVLTAPLCLTTVGNGKVTGATNGQPLEIGKSITLTATPGTGWVLTNWLVQVDGNTIISTNKAVPFPMQSNLCVTATFADIAKPALTISKPTTGQRWSNEVFTVSGKVTDNSTNGTVLYQLNGGAWEEASGWTNWSVVVNLLPGTNNVKACAKDAAGNRSATNSVNWVRVLTAPLCLSVVGNGKVSGATNGQPLEIGKSITLTTTPGTGWVLTNWLVQVESNTIINTNKAVAFSMQSNLCVTATFYDIAKPALTITAPTAGQRWSNEVFTVRGKVSDNNTNGEVKYQLNGGAWEEASGWSNWNVTVVLTPGTNVLKAYAKDAAGNRSTTNSVTCVYVLTYCVADYYYPTPQDSRFIYDGLDGDGTPGQLEVEISDTNYPLHTYTGTSPVTSYTQAVIRVQSAFGSYNTNTDVFTPFDDWQNYFVRDGCSFGYFGEESGGETLLVDHGAMFTNRIAVGQTFSLTRNLYTNGAYAGQGTIKVQLLDVSTVTVPADTFPGCLRIRVTRTAGGQTQSHDDWLAPGFGMVKQQGVSGEGAAERWALIRWTLPASRPAPAARATVPPPTPPTVQLLPNAAGGFSLILTGQPGVTYAIEAAETGNGDWQWKQIWSGTLQGDTTEVSINLTAPMGLYRARQK